MFLPLLSNHRLLFSAVLGSQQTRAKGYRWFPYSPNTHPQESSLSCYEHPCQSGPYSITDESARTRHSGPSPQSALGFALGVAHSRGRDKCIMTRTRHYNITQSSPTALKISAFHLGIPPAPQPLQPLIFYCLRSCAFSRTSDSWNQTVYSLFRLAFHSVNAFKISSCLFVA